MPAKLIISKESWYFLVFLKISCFFKSVLLGLRALNPKNISLRLPMLSEKGFTFGGQGCGGAICLLWLVVAGVGVDWQVWGSAAHNGVWKNTRF